MSDTTFNVLSEKVDSEPWEFYEKTRTVEVTGALADSVLKRTGKTGVVTIRERHYSSGTCELCGGEDDSFSVFVADEEVFVADKYVTAENATAFAAFAAWLKGVENE